MCLQSSSKSWKHQWLCTEFSHIRNNPFPNNYQSWLLAGFKNKRWKEMKEENAYKRKSYVQYRSLLRHSQLLNKERRRCGDQQAPCCQATVVQKAEVRVHLRHCAITLAVALAENVFQWWHNGLRVLLTVQWQVKDKVQAPRKAISNNRSKSGKKWRMDSNNNHDDADDANMLSLHAR